MARAKQQATQLGGAVPRNAYTRFPSDEERRGSDGKGRPWNVSIFRAITPEGEPIWPEHTALQTYQDLWDSGGGPLFNCTPAETPILMADWTFKPISEVQPGDMVVGFGRSAGGGKGSGGKRAFLKVSRVLRTYSKTDEVVGLTMESGRRVRCTRDHRWYTGRADANRKEYAPAKVGSRLLAVCPVADNCTEMERMLWWWLAGIIDGEGHISGGSCIIAQSPTQNPAVYARIPEVLAELGVSFHASYNATGVGIFWPHGTRAFYQKLLRLTRPAKAQQIIDFLFKRGFNFIQSRDTVRAIVPEGREHVYALETETGNYVAWGYASSNSIYMQDPSGLAGDIFEPEWFQYFCWPGYIDLGTGMTAEALLKEGHVQAILPDTRDMTAFQTHDLATSQKEVADYYARFNAYVDRKANIYVESVRQDRLTPLDMLDDINRAYQKFGKPIVGVEAVQFQSFLLMLMRDTTFLPVRALTPDSRDKVYRARKLATRYQQRKVFHRYGAPWQQIYEAQLTSFPGGAHDDMVDAASYIMDMLGDYVPGEAAHLEQAQRELRTTASGGELGRAIESRHVSKMDVQGGKRNR